jgi:hypothetical protein
MFFIVIPLKNSKLKTFNPWRIPSSKPFTAEEFQTQNPLPLKNSKLRTFYPWRIPSSKPSKLWKISISNLFTPEEFQAQNPLPLKIPSSKPFTPEEFHAQNTLPLKNSKFKTLYPWRIPGILDRGVRILNGIAHWSSTQMSLRNYCDGDLSKNGIIGITRKISDLICSQNHC